ncbi:unnamed protein product [Lathyrus oleraceus]
MMTVQVALLMVVSERLQHETSHFYDWFKAQNLCAGSGDDLRTRIGVAGYAAGCFRIGINASMTQGIKSLVQGHGILSGVVFYFPLFGA